MKWPWQMTRERTIVTVQHYDDSAIRQRLVEVERRGLATDLDLRKLDARLTTLEGIARARQWGGPLDADSTTLERVGAAELRLDFLERVMTQDYRRT